MKIYGIIKSSGSYEDCSKYPHKRFFKTIEEVEAERQKILNEIKSNKDKSDKCHFCEYQEYYNSHKSKGLLKEDFELRYPCGCFEYDDNYYWGVSCNNWCYDNEEHEPEIKEFELAD